MKTIRTASALRKTLRSLKEARRTLGFVPTMGYLHEGHLSLIRRARCENDLVGVSIFVNPTQFGPREDFRQYPRDLARDLELCRKEKADWVFVPTAGEIYPGGFQTFVEPGEIASSLCGRFRPGHFRGVATVVAKLFHLAEPSSAYFGQKDYQQCLVIRHMVRDLNFSVRIVVCPTVRDPDGLAMSSRNSYLDPDARRRALCLPEALRRVKQRILGGARQLPELKKEMRKILRRGMVRIDYAEILNARDLSTLKTLSGKIAVIAAGFVETGEGKPGGRREVRLIDNEVFVVPD